MKRITIRPNNNIQEAVIVVTNFVYNIKIT